MQEHSCKLYGLYTYLSKRGHDVKVIDYVMEDLHDMLPRGWYYYCSQPFALLKRQIKRRKARNSYNDAILDFSKELKVRDDRFKEAYALMKTTSKVSNEVELDKLNDSFDAFVVGGDQVWNAGMLNRRYFLDYVKDGKIKASYGPSMGLWISLALSA